MPDTESHPRQLLKRYPEFGLAVSVKLVPEVWVYRGWGSRAPKAASTWMRGLVMLFRESVIGIPVLFRAESTCSTEALGALDLSTAQAPATWGTAREVPDDVAK